MAIQLCVKEYCAECYDFEPEVTKPDRTALQLEMFDLETSQIVTRKLDTTIRCKYAKRCEAIKRYLSQQKGCTNEA